MHVPVHGRRALLAAALAAGTAWEPHSALAIKDCFQDCKSNCDRLARGSGSYCETSCGEYCAQDDRQDGLSGSLSNERGERGLLSAYDLKATLLGTAPAGVPFGEDKPPGFKLPTSVADELRTAVYGPKVL